VPLIYYNGGSRHQENIIKWTTLQLSRIYRQQTTNISVDFLVRLRTRVRTDLGKVWKVLEFNVEIFKALKSLEMIIGMEKSGNILETLMLTWKMQVSITYRCIC